ncbi:MAG: 1-acyl-sn-glycerol-3-phosphate acyltransferase [Bacteroidales bacterium]|nr:1-acyl-sn-glycerol-3-phosphate acyltransferase [Bacteroidales bacterium]MBQ7998730.1 1-acyl-sn-glycerol-3-phosphate acyltransferase [Bacteroidales bacterium]
MKYICKFLLWILGWKAMLPPIDGPKGIILGVPHTSAWDFVISWIYYTSVGGKASVMVKKEFFWGPLAPLMRSLGGVPVDRKRGATVAKQMIDAMNKAEKMHLAIAPEGTRQLTEKWKTGFHTIAKACDVPVYLGYFDWGRKQISRGERFELTDDAQADLKRIRQIYKEMGLKGKHPELFTTGKDIA